MFKSSHPHGRACMTQAHTSATTTNSSFNQAQRSVTMFDFIHDSVELAVYVQDNTIKLQLPKNRFKLYKTFWSIRCGADSQFIETKNNLGHGFHVIGQSLNGMCSLYGLQVYAWLTDGQQVNVPYEVLSVDGEPLHADGLPSSPSKEAEMAVEDKVKHAIKLIRSVSSMRNYTVAFSGGKDSVVLSYLTKEAGLKLPHVYNSTTIDPPRTLPFVLRHQAEIKRPKYSFLQLVEKKGFPTMFRRFCCAELKEQFISPYLMTGVRRDESVKRKLNYCAFEDTFTYPGKLTSTRLHPLLYFTDADMKHIITDRQLECHPLYYDADGQFNVKQRLGCIGCPLASDRGVSDFRQYPKLLRQIAIRGIKFHARFGRDANVAYENLVYNLFYSNHGFKRYEQTYRGLFANDAKSFLEQQFHITLP